MKHSYFTNYFIICLPSFFSIIKVIIELFVVNIIYVYAQLLFLLYKDKSNFVYALVSKCIIYTCIPFIYVDIASKIYTCSLFSIYFL